MDITKEIEFHSSKVIIYGAIFISFIIGGISTLIFHDSFSDFIQTTFITQIQVVLLLLSCYGIFIWAIHMAFSNPVLLKLDKDGMYSKSTGKILWSNIKNIEAGERTISQSTPGDIVSLKITLLNDVRIFLKTALFPITPEKLLELFKSYHKNVSPAQDNSVIN